MFCGDDDNTVCLVVCCGGFPTGFGAETKSQHPLDEETLLGPMYPMCH